MIDRRIGKIKVLRGTDSQRKSITFEEGELVYSTDTKCLYIGNSKQKGGILVSNRNYVKNSVGDPPVAPVEALHGDIIHDKSTSKTYITKCGPSSCELLLIADPNCCAVLQNEIDDLNDRIRILSACATYVPPPVTPPPSVPPTVVIPPTLVIPTKLTWYIEPSDVLVNMTEMASFTAVALGGSGGISYECKRRDNVDISTSSGNPSITIITNQGVLTFEAQTTSIATYYCIASTSTESITSRNAVLDIIANSILAEDDTFVLSELNEFIDWELSGLVAPTITIQPKSLTTTTLASVTFDITATGSTPLNYQWRINGSNIIGETNSTYTVSNPTKNITGIDCVVSNSRGYVVSNSVSLTL